MTDPKDTDAPGHRLLIAGAEELEALGLNVELLRFAFGQGLEAGRAIGSIPDQYPNEDSRAAHMAASMFATALGIGLATTVGPRLAGFVLERASQSVTEAAEQMQRQTEQARH